jgi:hypothetical protein
MGGFGKCRSPDCITSLLATAELFEVICVHCLFLGKKGVYNFV